MQSAPDELLGDGPAVVWHVNGLVQLPRVLRLSGHPSHGQEYLWQERGCQRRLPVDESAEDDDAVANLVLAVLLLDVAAPVKRFKLDYPALSRYLLGRGLHSCIDNQEKNRENNEHSLMNR